MCVRITPKLILWTITGVICMGLPFTAAAAPSMSGSTGMIRTPTADSLRLGQFSAGYYYWRDNGAGVVGAGLPAGLEISAAMPWKNGVSDTGAVNAKLSLLQEGILFPAVAVGVEDIGGFGKRSVYGVVSKALPFGLRVHIGTGTGRFDGMFGAVEKVLNPASVKKKQSGFPVTSIIIEMDGRKMNYGARMRLAKGLRLDAGWLGQDEKMYLGITFTN